MARNFTLADVLSAGADFASTVATIQDRQLKEKAETDLLYMRAQLDSEASAFMQDLAQRNDYSNWQKDLDSFITKQGNRLQKESANAYTAKRAQEMVLNYRGNLEQRVQLDALAKHKEDVSVTNAQTIALYRKNSTGQARVDNIRNVLDRGYASGTIGTSQYEASLQEETSSAAYDYLLQNATSLIPEAIKSGKGFSSIKNAIYADNTEFTVSALDSSSANIDALESGNVTRKKIFVDIPKIKGDVEKAAKAMYNAQLQDFQRQNESSLSEVYTKMRAAKTETERLAIAEEGINLLSTMQGDSLLPNVRDEYAAKFDLFKKNGGNLLNGSKKDVEKYVNELSKTDMNELIDQFSKAALRGSQSAFGGAENFYIARRSFQNVLSGKGVDPGEATTALHTLTEKFCKDVLNQPQYAGLKTRINAFIKDVSENRDKWPIDAIDHATGWMLDTMAQTNMSEKDSGDFEKEFDNMIATAYSKNVEKMLIVKNLGNEKEVGKVAAGLQSVDVVYTDVFGNTRWAGDTKEVITGDTGVATQFGKIVAQATGKTNLRQDWKQTDNGNDITNIPVFKDSDGNSYTVEPVFKNNNKDKAVIGYKVVDQNGKEYKGTDQEALKKEDNAKRKEFDKKKKDFRENFIKTSEEKRNKKRIERLNTVAEMKKAPSVDDFIKKSVLDNSNKKDFEKTLEILKNDWNKLSKEERLQRIYEIENATGKEYFN